MSDRKTSLKYRIWKVASVITVATLAGLMWQNAVEAVGTIMNAYLLFSGVIAGARAWEQQSKRKGE